MGTLAPDWWFAAHLHVRFEARVVHGQLEPEQSGGEQVAGANPDEIVIDDLDDVGPSSSEPRVSSSSATAEQLADKSVDGAECSRMLNPAHTSNGKLADAGAIEVATADEPAVGIVNVDADPEARIVVRRAKAKESNPDEIALDDLEEEVEAPPQLPTAPVAPSPSSEALKGTRETKFLALDKCLPRRHFLEVRPEL
jgi:lariat debranching enzyme